MSSISSNNYSNSSDPFSLANLLNPRTILTTDLRPSPTSAIASNFRCKVTSHPQRSPLQMPFQDFFPLGIYSQTRDPVFAPLQMAQATPITFANSVNPASGIQRDTFDLLIQVFGNILENRDLKGLPAINALKKMINNVSFIELVDVDNPILKSILNFHDISKEILLRANFRFHGKKTNESGIKNLDIKLIIEILHLLSLTASISVESRLIFLLLYETFNKTILKAKKTLQSIIEKQTNSAESSTTTKRKTKTPTTEPIPSKAPKKRRTRNPNEESDPSDTDEYIVSAENDDSHSDLSVYEFSDVDEDRVNFQFSTSKYKFKEVWDFCLKAEE